ncbi:coiled-coil domain-containing protein 106b isoform X2 [Astyanax mexicanus]|uniref:coiled-coil domain-containing protein 106b isoform X2 n=1 Tax=Astyanax mexicanus TaxID=7994 RepID=UPI000BBDE626|nr:coiled-coil domain-containing protein 106b isoform X2 [Astyanax mexicanus]
MTDAQKSSSSSADLKNEDGYEISIPFEDHNMDQCGFYNQNGHVFDGTTSDHSTSCNPYLLMTNLRAQLQISLEKNSWLQKRIEDLEEERDFLRCQLDRFIFTTKSQERSELHPEAGQQHTPQKTASRRALTPPPTPMMTRSGQIPSRNHSLKKRKIRNSSAQDEEEDDVIEEEEYLQEDGYFEEEELSDDESDGKSSRKGRSNGGHRVKRTRVFRIARSMERQRVKDPAGVLLRYNKILVTYQKLKSMSRAFQVHGVDRNTVASTTPIAELLLVAPEKVAEIGEFDSAKEKLLDYARRCYKALDEAAHAKVQSLKKSSLLLPISYRFRN